MVLMAANQPLSTSDPAIPRRRITVPFLRAVQNRDQRVLLEIDSDAKMASGEFAEYLPGLFNWVMSMSDHEMRRFLKDTDRAVQSLAEIKSETLIATNTMAAWFDDCCVFVDGAKAYVGKLSKTRITEGEEGHSESREQIDDFKNCLYPSYVRYCMESNHKYESMNHFSEKLTNLCATILEHPNVAKKRGGQGIYIVGIAFRHDHPDHPRPISGDLDDQAPNRSADPAPLTPEEVWESVPNAEKSAVKTIIDNAWSISSSADDAVKDLAKSWVATYTPSVRSHSMRYLKAVSERGIKIVERITKIHPEFANVA
jgi:hypothetical protein